MKSIVFSSSAGGQVSWVADQDYVIVGTTGGGGILSTIKELIYSEFFAPSADGVDDRWVLTPELVGWYSIEIRKGQRIYFYPAGSAATCMILWLDPADFSAKPI